MVMIVPLITALVLRYRWAKHVVWWEYLCQFAIAALLVFIMKVVIGTAQTTDTEYWGDLVQTVHEKEPWNEWVSQQCECCCDKEGKNCTKYDCSYQDDHSPNWWVTTVMGTTYGIDEAMYEKILQKFGGQRQVIGSVRNHSANSYASCRSDSKFRGKRVGQVSHTYATSWNQTYETHHFVASQHRYKNKVQASSSIFNYPEVTKEDIDHYGLYNYPAVNDNHDLPTILAPASISPMQIEQAEKKLKWLNGKLGPRGNNRQVRVWILIYDKKPSTVAQLQEAYWKNGNKNELVVTIGLKEGNVVDWCHVFTWSEVMTIPIDVRNFVLDQDTLNLSSLADNLYEVVEKDWHRKAFAEFSYLTVEPPMWSIIVALVLQLLVNIGWAFFSIRNEFTLSR